MAKKTRKKWGQKGRPTGMTVGITADARRLASDMKTYHQSLLAERNAIEQRIEAVGEAITAMGMQAPAVAATKRGPKRARAAVAGTRPGSLKAYIGEVLSKTGGPVSVKDITQGVVRAGYKTKSKTLGNQVSAAIAEMNVKKVGRGLYQV